MESCDTCGDTGRLKSQSMEDLRTAAKQRAKDENKTMAICIEEATGEYFIVDAFTATTQRFKWVEFLSGLLS